MPTHMIDPQLKAFATKRQVQIIDTINREGSKTKAAKVLGIKRSTLRDALKGVMTRAAKQGYSPVHDMTKTAPDGFNVKGVSTLYDADGNVKIQWVKTQLDADKFDMVQDAIRDGLLAECAGKSKPVTSPKFTKSELMTIIPIGDPHIGMYAWADETGADFDCAIAEAQIQEAITRLLASGPACDLCFILNLGDFFHSDTLENKTRRGGNVLDVDSRMSRVWQIGIKTMVNCINLAKKKHKKVIVRNEIGNHDEQTSMMLSLVLNEHYRNDPRVEINTSPSKFFYMKFGRCLFGSTHGDTTKIASLPGIMATDRSELWGQTIHRYWYIGHLHHSTVFEPNYGGCIVEQFRTLASKDAWHAGQGYRSGRDMSLRVIHKEHGEIERHRVDISQLATQ